MKPPTVPIETKISMAGNLADLITYAKFQYDILGYDFTWGRISHFPIDFCMGLTTVQRYFAACDSSYAYLLPNVPMWLFVYDCSRSSQFMTSQWLGGHAPRRDAVIGYNNMCSWIKSGMSWLLICCRSPVRLVQLFYFSFIAVVRTALRAFVEKW